MSVTLLLLKFTVVVTLVNDFLCKLSEIQDSGNGDPIVLRFSCQHFSLAVGVCWNFIQRQIKTKN